MSDAYKTYYEEVESVHTAADFTRVFHLIVGSKGLIWSERDDLYTRLHTRRLLLNLRSREEAYEAEMLIRSIRPGDKVTILVPNGRGLGGLEFKEATGRAVICNGDSVALNMGGSHGTPGVATESNIVRVRKYKYKL